MDEDKKKTILIAIWCAAAVVLLAGAVAAWFYFSQFKSYHDQQFKFTLLYPSKWKKVEHFQGTAVTFARPKESALETVVPNVNITVQEVPEHIATLSSFSETITKQMLAVFDKNVVVLDDSDCQFAGRVGHRLVILAPKPDRLKMVFKWTIKGSFVYIFTFLAREDQYKVLTPTIKRMVDSFELK